MLPSQHVFSHQQQYQAEPSWLHQQQSHHQQQHQGHMSHQHAQAQSAAAVAAVAQQNHYNRIAASNSNNNSHGHSGHAINSDPIMANGMDGSFTDENRRVLGWVAELLNGNSRETALMELSKKREQVPELALIIWHSFGMRSSVATECLAAYSFHRCHDFITPGDYLCLPSSQPLPAHCCRVESCL